MQHARIIGTGSYVPDNIMTNDDLAEIVDTSDEWISSRTGIKERRISKGESTSEMAYYAALKAIENANISVMDLDLIICATITPDSFMPSVACMVQERLGAKKAAAFDLSAACTGMIYAMVTSAMFIENGVYQKILVIGAETLSKVLNWNDRSTCVLFGDGAGAVVMSVSQSSRGGMIAHHLFSDGEKQSYLTLPSITLKNPYVQPETTDVPYILMKGQEVFKYAVRSIADNIKLLLSKAKMEKEDIQYIITHQANFRIIEHAAKISDISLDKFYVNLERYGNTSAASIGIALDEMNRKEIISAGDKIILVGFGGGMTSGAILMEWA